MLPMLCAAAARCRKQSGDAALLGGKFFFSKSMLHFALSFLPPLRQIPCPSWSVTTLSRSQKNVSS